MSHLS